MVVAYSIPNCMVFLRHDQTLSTVAWTVSNLLSAPNPGRDITHSTLILEPLFGICASSSVSTLKRANAPPVSKSKFGNDGSPTLTRASPDPRKTPRRSSPQRPSSRPTSSPIAASLVRYRATLVSSTNALKFSCSRSTCGATKYRESKLSG